MRIHVLVALVFGSLSAFANRIVNCDELGNNLVNNANLATPTQYDKILEVRDGKAKVGESERVVSRETKGNLTTVTFNRQVPVNAGWVQARETVKFETNGDGYTIDYLVDPKASLPGTIGQRARVQRQASGSDCTLDQFSTLSKGPSGEVFEVVNQDRKFCDSVAEQMKALGKANFSQCNDLLQKVANAYNQRAMELSSAQKLFFESGVNNSIQTAMMSLNNCGPDEWYETITTSLGPQRVLKYEGGSPLRDRSQGRVPTPPPQGQKFGK